MISETPQPNISPSFIMLAPMEGIVDHTMREIFAQIGGLDRCVTEFIRISSQVFPERVFKRSFPEITHGSTTSNGTQVYAQLLGDNESIMARNAQKLCRMGAAGIDINFGCPAKTVIGHGGGSILLNNPENLYRITHAIRAAVPDSIPVTAKIRLGYEDKSLMQDNAAAIETAGASEIAIHGRTKVEGYKPPAYWDKIGEITAALSIPVIANGEMWNLHDIQRCIKESGTSRIMLGRGLVACPDLALLAREEAETPLNWAEICLLLLHYKKQLNHCCPEKYINSLIKQWLVYLRERYPQAHLFFQHIKRIRTAEAIEQAIIDELQLQARRLSIKPKIGQLDLQQLFQEQLLERVM